MQIESEEDVLWRLEHRESHEEIKRRGVRFLQVRCRLAVYDMPSTV